MSAEARVERLLAFVLAVAATCVLVLLFVAFDFRAGDLSDALGGLSTAGGLALFLVLLAPTWFASVRAVRSMHVDGALRQPVQIWFVAMLWGAIDGCLLVALPALLFVVVVPIGGIARIIQGDSHGGTTLLLAGPFFGSLAFVGALTVGGSIGLAFGCFATLLAWLARSLVGVDLTTVPDRGTRFYG